MQPPPSSLPRAPLGLALILARSVSLDAQTGTLSIVAPYSDVIAVSFPVAFPTMEAYAVLTECDGDVLVELRLVDASEARPPVFRQLVSVHFNDPQDVREVIFHRFFATIPVEGEYRLQLYVHGSGKPIQETVVPVLERQLVVARAVDLSEGDEA